MTPRLDTNVGVKPRFAANSWARHALVQHVPLSALSVAVLCFYLVLVERNSNIYWGDAIVRIAQPDNLTLGRWLPATQAVIMAIHQISDDFFIMRAIFVLIGIGSLIAIYSLAAHFWSRTAGLVALILAGTNVMFGALAIVPYPDVLFIGLLCLALRLLDAPQGSKLYALGVIGVIGASLTRYEGWLLIAVLVADNAVVNRRASGLRVASVRAGRDLLLFGTPAMIWLLLGNADLQSGETELSERLSIGYLGTFIEGVAELLRWQTSVLILTLGAIGAVASLNSQSKTRIHRRLLTFVGLELAVLYAVSPWSPENLRQVFVLVVVANVYAAGAIVLVSGWIMTRLRGLEASAHSATILALGVTSVIGLNAAAQITDFVHSASRDPRFYHAQQAGAWVRAQQLDGARILLLTDDALQPYAFAAYARLSPGSSLSDDFYSEVEIESDLQLHSTIIVIAVDASDDGLSARERELLRRLESGQLTVLPLQTEEEVRAWKLDAAGLQPAR